MNLGVLAYFQTEKSLDQFLTFEEIECAWIHVREQNWPITRYFETQIDRKQRIKLIQQNSLNFLIATALDYAP